MDDEQLIHQLAQALEFYVSQAYTAAGAIAMISYDAWVAAKKEKKYPPCGCRSIPNQLPFDWKEGMHTHTVFIPCEAHKNGAHSHST